MPPEGASRCRRTQDWGTPGEPKICQKMLWKTGAQKEVPKRFWGAHGEPQGAPGSPNEAKMGAKRLQKRSPKRHCLRLGWKMENVTKTYYLLHFSHIGRPRKS